MKFKQIFFALLVLAIALGSCAKETIETNTATDTIYQLEQSQASSERAVPTIKLDKMACTLTYEQGLQVGCNLATAAFKEDGCCRFTCSSDFMNTIEDFDLCGDYISGLYDGWVIALVGFQ